MSVCDCSHIDSPEHQPWCLKVFDGDPATRTALMRGEPVTDVDEMMALQADVASAPQGQVRRYDDNSIAYRTNKPSGDPDAWLIIRTDGTTIGAGHVTVEEMSPLLRWRVMSDGTAQ